MINGEEKEKKEDEFLYLNLWYNIQVIVGQVIGDLDKLYIFLGFSVFNCNMSIMVFIIYGCFNYYRFYI